jgi:hypothetical protein
MPTSARTNAAFTGISAIDRVIINQSTASIAAGERQMASIAAPERHRERAPKT